MPTKREFQVGDVCRIRQWDDMAEEFGQNDYEINCEFFFTNEMRHLCGKTFTINSIKIDGRTRKYHSDERVEYERCGDPEFAWNISADMLELLYSPSDCEGEDLSAIDGFQLFD